MSDLLGALQARFGYLSPRSTLMRTVGETDDLRRIRDMARREWDKDPNLDEWVTLLTGRLKYDHSTCSGPCEGCKALTLNKAQARFLGELMVLGVGFAPFRVGAGKTLASLLAPTVLGAKRPVLIVPASLLAKTASAQVQYARHWRLLPIKVVSYEWLANPAQLGWLAEYQPDLILVDEAHKLKNSACKVWKRIVRYFKAIGPGKCRLVPFTGTPTGRSMREYWHYVRGAMGSYAPLPSNPMEMAAWAYALDEKVPPEAQFAPGALLTLSPGPYPEEDEERTRARKAFRDRLVQTPGIVSTLEDVPPVGLLLKKHHLTLPPGLEATIQQVRDTWETPNGESFKLALEMWTHCRTLGCGLFYRWDPPAPEPWKNVRRMWSSMARKKLVHAQSWDSVVHLIERIKAGEEPELAPILAAWEQIEPTFEPNSIPVWLDDTALRFCADWMAQEGRVGLCWVEHRPFGDRLSQMTGLPFFAEEGLDQRGRLIDDFTGPAIVSIASCREGHNLQAYWENLVVNPMSRGDRHEQLLGRTHREHQLADQVECTYLITGPESEECLAQACRDAACVQDSTGQLQKLVYANKEW